MKVINRITVRCHELFIPQSFFFQHPPPSVFLSGVCLITIKETPFSPDQRLQEFMNPSTDPFIYDVSIYIFAVRPAIRQVF